MGASRIHLSQAAFCIVILVSIPSLVFQVLITTGSSHERLQLSAKSISKQSLSYSPQQELTPHTNAESGVQTLIAKPDFDFRLSNGKTTVILVASDRSHLIKYAVNILSIDCYSRVHGLVLWVVPADHSSFAHCSTEQGFFFARHCIAASVLQRNRNTIEMLTVLDADIAVVNMRFDIQSFLPMGKDMAFSMRCFNQEIAASSYIASPSDFAIRFLKRWHTFRFPWNGDNGALHPLVLEYMGVQDTCTKVGEGKQYHSYLHCFHRLVRESNCSHDFFEHVVIWLHLEGWEYDGWVVNYTWSPGLTFMHHAMKNPPIVKDGSLSVASRVAPIFKDCHAQDSVMAHVDDFKVSDEQMSAHMALKMHQWQSMWKVQGFGDMQSCLWSSRPKHNLTTV
eukprot:2789737-Rhodomonas_salina.1